MGGSLVARRFKVGITSVRRWCKKIEPQYTRNKPATTIDMEALKKDVEDYPDAYNYERAKRLGASSSGIRYALKRLGMTYKKKPASSTSGGRKARYLLPKD